MSTTTKTTTITTTITTKTTTKDIAGKIQIFFENMYLAYHYAKPSAFESRIPVKSLTEILEEFQYLLLTSLTKLHSEKLKKAKDST